MTSKLLILFGGADRDRTGDLLNAIPTIHIYNLPRKLNNSQFLHFSRKSFFFLGATSGATCLIGQTEFVYGFQGV